MTGLYVALVLVVVAGVAGTVWLRSAGDQAWLQHQLRASRRLHVDLVFDAGPFVAAMRQASRAAAQLSRAFTRRPCGCPEACEHDRGCPEHPLNRGLWSAWRWRSRHYATAWHRWRRHHLVAAADRHWFSETAGRWRR